MNYGCGFCDRDGLELNQVTERKERRKKLRERRKEEKERKEKQRQRGRKKGGREGREKNHIYDYVITAVTYIL